MITTAWCLVVWVTVRIGFSVWLVSGRSWARNYNTFYCRCTTSFPHSRHLDTISTENFSLSNIQGCYSRTFVARTIRHRLYDRCRIVRATNVRESHPRLPDFWTFKRQASGLLFVLLSACRWRLFGVQIWQPCAEITFQQTETQTDNVKSNFKKWWNQQQKLEKIKSQTQQLNYLGGRSLNLEWTIPHKHARAQGLVHHRND